MTIHVVVMGVAGCGKSAVGRRVAAALALPMVEGDDFHPPANVERMRQGVALTDADRAGWLAQLGDVLQQHPAGAVLSMTEQADMKRWKGLVEERANQAKQLPDAKKATAGDYVENLQYSTEFWYQFNLSALISPAAGEAFFTMLIGMALFKWGILQGGRSTRFYVALAILGYAVGIFVKWAMADFRLAHHFGPVSIGAAVYDYGRIGTTLGHVGLVCLLLKSGIGRRVLAMFKAPGRMPMTAYVGQTLICCWLLFPGFGLGLWGRFGWADLMLIATAVNVLLIGFCNLWMLRYRMGPFEWVWRSLSYLERPTFRRDTSQSNPTAALA